jgi:murein DD-endopeptidase MepM/ murein hydrolase activator NlpD
MERLTDHEVAFIERELERHGMPDDALRRELLDHLCCQVEEALEGGKDFSAALDQAFAGFGDKDPATVRRETLHTVQAPIRRRRAVLATFGVAATLGLAWVTLASTPPTLQPLPAFTAQNVRFLEGPQCAEFIAPACTPVLASADGEVIFASETDTALGRVVIIRHDSVHTTVYGNLAGLEVEPGTVVHKGEIIGHTGIEVATGESKLHYEVHRFGHTVDPEGFLRECIAI